MNPKLEPPVEKSLPERMREAANTMEEARKRLPPGYSREEYRFDIETLRSFADKFEFEERPRPGAAGAKGIGMTVKALIIVDVQNDFISGSLAVPGGEDVAESIADYVILDEPDYDYIVSTQDWHIAPGNHFADEPDYVNTWPAHCMSDDWGAKLYPAMEDILFREQFLKGHFSAAYSGFEGVALTNPAIGLLQWLQTHEVTDVDICGIATDYCVKATALDAAKHGFATTVLLPLTAAVAAATRKEAVDEMRAAGINIKE